jgi:hypothetical protein
LPYTVSRRGLALRPTKIMQDNLRTFAGEPLRDGRAEPTPTTRACDNGNFALQFRIHGVLGLGVAVTTGGVHAHHALNVTIAPSAPFRLHLCVGLEGLYGRARDLAIAL